MMQHAIRFYLFLCQATTLVLSGCFIDVNLLPVAIVDKNRLQLSKVRPIIQTIYTSDVATYTYIFLPFEKPNSCVDILEASLHDRNIAISATHSQTFA